MTHKQEQIEFGKLHTAIKRYCRTLADNPWDAEDLAQETWSKAIGKGRIDGHANPQALLMRIAKTTWVDRCRKRQTAEKFEKREQNSGRAALAPPSPHPAERVELEPAFQALLDHLTPTQRAVFLLKDVFDFSLAETAGKLDMTEGAVKAALHRARKALHNIRRELDADLLPATDCPPGKHAALPNGTGAPSPLLRRLVEAYLNGDVDGVIRFVTVRPIRSANGDRHRSGLQSGGVFMVQRAAA